MTKLDRALDIMWSHFGKPDGLEKNASAEYMFNLRKPYFDREALGKDFCKLSEAIGQDPWDLAVQVAGNISGISKVAEGDDRSQELACFYVNWAEDLVKRASLWGRVAGAGRKLLGGAKAAPKSGTASRTGAGVTVPTRSSGVGKVTATHGGGVQTRAGSVTSGKSTWKPDVAPAAAKPKSKMDMHTLIGASALAPIAGGAGYYGLGLNQ
jgi:hypothetical protein